MFEHNQVTVTGGWSGANLADEVWTFGFKSTQFNGQGTSDLDTWAASLRTSLAALWTPSGTSVVASDCVLRTVKIAAIGTDGKYQYEPATAGGADVAGGVTGGSLPPQNTMVVTTIAPVIVSGPGRYGRFYLPGVPLSFVSGGIISTTFQSRYNTFAKAMLAAYLAANPSIIPVDIRHFPPGDIAPAVTRLQTGRVVDTQRRRRNSIREVPIAVTFP